MINPSVTLRTRSAKAILLNGPPRSGKDFMYTLIAGSEYAVPPWDAVRISFATPLKNGVNRFLNLIGAEAEKLKDDAARSPLGVSVRDAYIGFSERFAKPVYGDDVFVRLALLECARTVAARLFVFTDCGFQQEVDSIGRAFGENNVLLVHLHRANTSYAGDSRSYCNPVLDMIHKQYHNDHAHDVTKLLITEIVRQFVEEGK